MVVVGKCDVVEDINTGWYMIAVIVVTDSGNDGKSLEGKVCWWQRARER